MKKLTFTLKNRKIQKETFGGVIAESKVIDDSNNWLFKNAGIDDQDISVFEKYEPWIVRMDLLVMARSGWRKIPEGQHTEEEWRNLKERYNNTCPRCGRREPEIKLTKDHIIPRSFRWRHLVPNLDNIDNIQPLCEDCNREKADKVKPKFHPWHRNDHGADL